MKIQLNMGNVDWNVVEQEVDVGIQYFCGLINENEMTIEESIVTSGKIAEALAEAMTVRGQIQ